MQSIYKKFILPITLLTFMSAIFLLVESCKKDDETDATLIVLNSFGPSPALRGGDLRFIGKNLDQVTAIVLPSNVEVTNFKSKSATEIVLTVPDATVNGVVKLKTPQGDLTTKTALTISEPIVLTSFAPAKARPGDVVTIEGNYLNLIKEVIFSNKKSVLAAAFTSQTKTKIEVKVPADAQSGVMVISNGMPEPILIESATPLDVTLPAGTAITPNPVKAGTSLTITGTDLDLVREVAFPGSAKITTFDSQAADKIVLKVPADAKDGEIKLVAQSLVETAVTVGLQMLLPTVSGLSPNPVKPGTTVTISGTNLDLVTSVGFGGGKSGTIQSGGTASSITVSVPVDAQTGTLQLGTAAAKSVTTNNLEMIKPSIASIAPMDIQFTNELTITGTNLDLVTNVKFSGGKEAAPSSVTATAVKVNVPVGTTNGAITVVAANGDEVSSSASLNILASTSATIVSMPTDAKPGQMISIEGTNLAEVTEVIFPVGINATMFGAKTDVLIQVVVPANVKTGMGTIQLKTATGEIITSPVINIQGVDPVTDPSLVFFNFDGLDAWWGDAGAPENDPALSLDGSKYHRVNKDCNGWTGLFWRNGANNFPGAVIGTNVANYVLKFDINVLEPITGGEFSWRLKGSSGDHWYGWKPWAATGSYVTSGWVTVTINLTDFYAGSTQLADLSTINEDFGVAFNAGTSKVNACIDNVRFELK
jgi:Surface glycan-binding protein B xyloglucan binding domain/IPT/TIG domain